MVWYSHLSKSFPQFVMNYNKNIMFYILYRNVIFSWRTLIHPSIWYNWYSLLVKKKKWEILSSNFSLWASLVARLVKNPPAMQETWFDSRVGRSPGEGKRPPTPVFWPGEFHGLYSPWGRKESDTTEQPSVTSLSPFRPNCNFLKMEINFPKSNAIRLYVNTRNMSMSGLEKWIRNRDM